MRVQAIVTGATAAAPEGPTRLRGVLKASVVEGFRGRVRVYKLA